MPLRLNKWEIEWGICGHAPAWDMSFCAREMWQKHAKSLSKRLKAFTRTINKSGLAFVLDKIASLYTVTGNPELAARLIGWSDKTRQEIGDPRASFEQASVDCDIAAIMAKIGAHGFEGAYTSGQEMTLDEAIALTLREK
jgi:hypothetical protein